MSASQTRILAILLALSVVVGSWLLFEFGEAAMQRQLAAGQPTAPAPSPSASGNDANASAGPLPPAPSAPPAVSQRSAAALIFKCRGAKGIAYRDHPCLSHESELQVSAAGPMSAPRHDLRQRQARAAAMEAERLHGEAQQRARLSRASEPAAKSHRSACDAVDRAVGGIDSLLRQPHSAAAGDSWTAQRKELMDRRFFIGC